MVRVKPAVLILLLALVLALGSHLAVRHVTAEVEAQLLEVRALACADAYSDANLCLTRLLSYYESQQHLLELFIKRESVAALSVNLHGLHAYLSEDNLSDLCSEIDKAAQQTRMMHHLYFSIL